MGFVELHFHLLPGVDDGPSSTEESVALAAAAVADGTRTVVATPHVHAQHVTDPSEIPARVRNLAEFPPQVAWDQARTSVLECSLESRTIIQQLDPTARGNGRRRDLVGANPCRQAIPVAAARSVSARAEATDDRRDDRDEVDLTEQRLDHRQRVS